MYKLGQITVFKHKYTTWLLLQELNSKIEEK